MISRRRLIVTGALLAGGVAVGFAVPPALRLRSRLQPAPILGDPGWIVIAPDETVTLYSTLVEMGQGVWTALAQIVNEELDADFARVRVEMAPSWRAFSQPVHFGTSSSSSIQRISANMRSMGAAARRVLIEAAASTWNVPANECTASNGIVRHEPSHREATYGSLAARAAGRQLPANPALKSRDQWRFVGKSVPRIDAAAKVNGSVRYAMDLQLPGMLVAAVSQSPLSGCKVEHVDRAAALASPGVVRVVELDDTVAVVARNHWSASRGLARAQVKWSAAPDTADSTQLRAKLRERAEAGLKPADSVAPAGRLVRALYEAPLLSHAQLEPQCAVAHVGRFSAEIWAPTQQLDRMRDDVAAAVGLWTNAVTVHAPLSGGAFGRRRATAHAVTAARISKGVSAPVKAIWSRADDFLQDVFRPMSAAQLQAVLDAKGLPSSLDAQVAWLGERDRRGALAESPYAIPNVNVTGSGIPSPVRLGEWRSVDSSQTVFFRECFLDECAAAAGVDPLAYRRSLLAGRARALRVLDTVAAMSGWGEAGRHVGVAFHEEWGSPCAQVVEVERRPGEAPRVKRVFVAVDCGTAINPNGVLAQIEGGVLMGLSSALREEITYENGTLGQLNFDTYRVLRMNDAPAVEVRILESPDAPIGGIGEAGVPPLAPALVNAVFAATGQRVRSLPLSRAGVAWP